MQRFVSEGPATLTPGQTGTLSDGRGFKVVAAVPLNQDRCEFLAVTNPPPEADVGTTAQPDDTEATTAGATHRIIVARQLPLPYSLPRTGT
jgi:hypothetical protein